ncbi:MAG: hypothetical protein CL912_07015 [Deltaproteobacteria bacterium]|nr:hypothetical protein [Deltaproteobacteria bacterium]
MVFGPGIAVSFLFVYQTDQRTVVWGPNQLVTAQIDFGASIGRGFVNGCVYGRWMEVHTEMKRNNRMLGPRRKKEC